MDKFKNKYRISSARLQSWDYRSNGSYFITICTKNWEHYFGEIVDGEMQLNETGNLAEQYWIEIPDHLPNHVHGILIIDKRMVTVVETLQCNVSTTNAKATINPTTTTKNQQMTKISPKPGSISTIIRSYKSVVSKNAPTIHADFKWQPRFHDHIIRDAASFERIQHYIANNPRNWKEDKFNPGDQGIRLSIRK